MNPNGGLREQHRFVRLDTARHHRRCNLPGLVGQLRLIERHGDGVQIHDAEHAVPALILQPREFLQGTEIISEVEITGGLDTGKDALRSGIGWGLLFTHGAANSARAQARLAPLMSLRRIAPNRMAKMPYAPAPPAAMARAARNLEPNV